MSRFGILTIQIVVLFCLSGCVPGVAWKPDSSGFVYTDKEGKQLLEYDLKTKKARVLVADTATKTTAPAISPDGKRLAVARFEERKGLRSRVQVILYSNDGKEQRRSAWHEVKAEPGKGDSVEEACLYWGSPNRVLLLLKGTFLYDLDKDRLIPLPGIVPMFFHTFTQRPDGQGFLAYREGKDEVEFYFVEWDGTAKALKGKVRKEDDWAFVEWDKEVALLQARDRLLEADTARLTLIESKRKPMALLESEGERLGYWTFPGKSTALCLYRIETKNGPRVREYRRIEMHNLVERKRVTIVPDSDAAPIFFPSPDRKYLALMIAYPKAKSPTILVLDAKGKTVAEVKTDP